MTEMSLKISQKSDRDLIDLMREMKKVTGQEMRKVVRNTGRDIAGACMYYTPKVKAGTRPRWTKSGGKYIPVRKKGGGIAMYSLDGGLTKGVWDGVRAKLGYKNSKASAQAKKMAVVAQIKKNGFYDLYIANQAPWIEDFNHGINPTGKPLAIPQKALQRVKKQMARTLYKMAERAKKRLGLK